MKLRKRNYVYSVQITKEQNKLLKDSPDLKRDLNKYVREYLESFLEIDEEETEKTIKNNRK